MMAMEEEESLSIMSMQSSCAVSWLSPSHLSFLCKVVFRKLRFELSCVTCVPSIFDMFIQTTPPLPPL